MLIIIILMVVIIIPIIVKIEYKKLETAALNKLGFSNWDIICKYDEIKDYIFDKHCVKVSSLYIAKIKQKHGIIERDCYNNSKKDNTKQPQCPPEKVKLIEEALRHFKMIP